MLTETKIKRLPIPSVHPKMYSDHGGLYLKHATSGRKTWVYRSRKGGSWTVKKLGDYPQTPLVAARALASRMDGTATSSPLVTDLVDEFWEARIEHRYKQVRNTRIYATRLKEHFGQDRVEQLTTRELVDDLKRYATTAPVGANRCLGFWKLVFRFAVESGYIKTSPIQYTSVSTVGGEEKGRDVTLTDDDIKELWKSDHKHAPLLRGLLLTGCRISELRVSKRTDIDGDKLHIPENKSSRPHWVHITPALQDQFGKGDKLFDIASATAVQARLKRYEYRWRPHDLRRTFATIAAGYSAPHVVSKCLNHSLPGMLAVYNRHDYKDEREKASQAVADHIRNLVDG